MINDDLDSVFGIQNSGRTRRPPLVSPIGAGMDARHSCYDENELPQPQDLVEFGFTNTKPCCIRVS